MIRRTFLAAFAYVTGAIALLYWSIAGFAAGAPREDWALMIVLPAAWMISFWPMFGSFVMISKVWTIQGTLERIADGIKTEGAADEKDLRELEDVVTKLAADENGIPEFIARPFVRKAIARVAWNRAVAAGSGNE